MIGKTVSHYKIVEKLGEGGMGVVYKAEDMTLGRTVALKFLPPELTRDAAAKERFVQEARAASALDHPNICTIHEVAQTEDGQTFIAMAYYEGENLKSKIERGPLKLEEALEIAVQMAQGLAKAHGQGIVHRDIKPANILITKDGLVKIVDFGLAKLAGMKVTKTGATLGTAQYMSPEQARGEEVDARSDIFSLGAVLYEMITGKHAFPGEYEQATLYAIMNEEPEPVTALRSGIPMELERIVVKALAKKPGERYQHADDLIVDLKNIAKISAFVTARASIRLPERTTRRTRGIWIPVVFLIIATVAMSAYFVLLSRSRTRKPAVTATAPATAPQFAAQVWRDSIAVLPFKDFSPQKDQEYFCDGMMEDIITKLSSIRDLKVISRTSAMQYKRTDKSIGEIGRELGVGAVLEGSVQKEKDRIRVTAQLIRTADDAHLWAEKYDRGLASVFEVQDEISMAIVDALKLKLTAQEKQGISKLPIDNVAAYECYLKAVHEIRRFDEASLNRALQDLQNGIAIIGDNALLYSGLAYAYYQYVNIGVKQEEYIEKAEAHANKALALDPECPQAYVVLGKIYSAFRGNQQEAVRQYKKALSLNANEQSALSSLAGSYAGAGKTAAVLAVLEKCRQVDPLNVQNYNSWFDLYIIDGKYELALEWSRRKYEADPESPFAQGVYALALAYNKKVEEAISIVDKAVAATPNNVMAKFGLLLKYGLLKERDKALQVMTPEFQETCKRDYEWSYSVASSLSLLGAKSEALDWLENSLNRGYINYPWFERDPFLDNIRGEERFKKLMERVKYEWEHFEV
jgi:serine/threonine protein kinase/tetratricopeptide (TPR) repeat protein